MVVNSTEPVISFFQIPCSFYSSESASPGVMNNRATSATQTLPTLTASGFSLHFINYSSSLVPLLPLASCLFDLRISLQDAEKIHICSISYHLINNWVWGGASKTMNCPKKRLFYFLIRLHWIMKRARHLGPEDHEVSRQAWLTLPITRTGM